MSGTGWLLVHLVCTAALAGVGWTVQLVVYPAFALVGPQGWAAYHARHTRAITRAVALPWAVQGASTLGLLLRPPRAGFGVSVALAALALAAVVVTVASAVPAHGRLADGFGAVELRGLLRANLVRTLVWTAATVAAAVLLAPAL